MAKGMSSNVPAVTTPDPIAPVSPTATSSQEVSMAGREDKERIRKAFSHSKTVLSRAESQGKQTLG